MKFINKIRIKFFRSIYDVEFEDISDTLTVFTGKNDIGKSNVLRALNLFFNDETDVEEEILFDRDFSKIRKKEITERIKTRQLISIDIQFQPPSGYKILQMPFWVGRTFDRYNEGSDYIFKDIKGTKQIAAARRFLNSIQFTYIPAIKDIDTFDHILQSLKSSLPPLAKEDLDVFNTKLETYGEDLKTDFERKLSLKPMLSLPSTTKELFSTLDFAINDGVVSTSLAQRGDGVRCRFLPSIMNYIAKISPDRHIWGIEEPENSLEFFKAMELSQTLEKEYSENAQILVTSHSPAFVGFIENDSRKSIYFLDRNDKNNVIAEKIDKDLLSDEKRLYLSEKLGYVALQKDLADCLKCKITDIENMKRSYETLSTTDSKIILCVEGETDKTILENAWKKLFPSDIIPTYINICFSCTQIKSVLCNVKTSAFPEKIFIGLFDFDMAFSQWNGLGKEWDIKQKNEDVCLLRKKRGENLYAMLLPIPNFRTEYASKELGDKSELSIELLFNDDKIKRFTHNRKCLGGGCIKEFNRKQKVEFSQLTKNFSKDDFEEFGKIFQMIDDIKNGVYND